MKHSRVNNDKANARLRNRRALSRKMKKVQDLLAVQHCAAS